MTPPDSPSPRTDLCPECASDQPRWVALERQGQRCTDPWHGTYTAQEAPAPVECGICGDYTAKGIEVHAICLAAQEALAPDGLLREAVFAADAVSAHHNGDIGHDPNDGCWPRLYRALGDLPSLTWRDASPQEWDEANAALSAPPSPAEPPRPDYAALADAETAIIEAVRSGDGVGGIKAFQAYRDIIRAEAQAEHSEPKEVSDD